MFIEAVTRRARPPPGGQCLYYESLVLTIDLALLTEGVAHLTERGLWFRLPPINITLLAEGECPNSSHPTEVGC